MKKENTVKLHYDLHGGEVPNLANSMKKNTCMQKKTHNPSYLYLQKN